MTERHKSIPAVYLILKNSAGEMLLARRCNSGYCDGLFSLPAGHVEDNEPMVQTMIREAREEIGIELLEKDLILAHVRDRNAADGHRLDFYFVCTTWKGEPKIMEPEKCSELYWTNSPESHPDIIPSISDVFRCIGTNQCYSQENWS